MPFKAVRTVSADDAAVHTVDRNQARCFCVEKVLGGGINSSCIPSGVMMNKDIAHPQTH